MPDTTTVTQPTSFDRAFGIGIALNIAYVAVEAFYGWNIDSLALLADAGHNFSDVIGLVLAWGGALAGRLRPDARYTYGWKRASILAAYMNALLLLVAMESLAWEAVHRLLTPQAVEGVTIMVVAGIGIVVNTMTALLFMRGRKTDLNIRRAFLHMAADVLVSAGVVVAGGLALWFGRAWLDPVVSLLIAAIIVAGTRSLFKKSLHLLFDGVPESVDLHAMQTLLESLPGAEHVHDLNVWAIGISEIAMTAHPVMPQGSALDADLRPPDAVRRRLAGQSNPASLRMRSVTGYGFPGARSDSLAPPFSRPTAHLVQTGQPRCGVLLFLDRSRYRTMNPTATLSSKYQISIPKAIRAAQHWEAGVTFAFIPKGTGVLLVPVPKLETLKGIARGASPEGYRDRSDRF